MWIVKIALDRPYTFIVLALLILIAAPVVIMRTPTDIFPNINIPVVSVGWTYTGLNPEELEGRLTTPYEKALTTLVDNIQHIESTTYNGEAIVKVFLQPGASLDTANAQVTAASQFIPRTLPPGTLPPQIINFSASSRRGKRHRPRLRTLRRRGFPCMPSLRWTTSICVRPMPSASFSTTPSKLSKVHCGLLRTATTAAPRPSPT